MFPNSNYEPTFPFKFTIDINIALDIGAKLLLPKFLIVFRFCCMQGARVPETTIDKN